jgi:hypothetical protein
LARRLLFTSSKCEYVELKAVAIIDFQLAYEEAIVDRIPCAIRVRLYNASSSLGNARASADPL